MRMRDYNVLSLALLIFNASHKVDIKLVRNPEQDSILRDLPWWPVSAWAYEDPILKITKRFIYH
ncbi:MAG: hypothetical protein CME32_09805 [Gimesia sp.]|nr:hypothetical protein [Gimesia sp.]